MDELLHQVLTALRGMWRRRWIGLAVAWVAALAGAVIVLRIPDRYEATARVFVDTQTVLKPLMSGLAVQPNIEEQISMLARTLIARPNIEKIVSSTDLDVAVTSQLQKDRLVDDVAQRIRFGTVGRENIYSIRYQDVNPERAKRIVQNRLSLFVGNPAGATRGRDLRGGRAISSTRRSRVPRRTGKTEEPRQDFRYRPGTSRGPRPGLLHLLSPCP